MGKAILANLPAEDRDHAIKNIELIAHTPNTILDSDALKAELEVTRTKGYAVNNEEFIPGLLAIGAPLMNFQTGEVIGAISFDFSLREHSLDLIIDKYSTVLLKLASDLSDIMTITEN